MKLGPLIENGEHEMNLWILLKEALLVALWLIRRVGILLISQITLPSLCWFKAVLI